ncbi:MAG: PQQ-binding-like beta-propeller repeat protein, partial [Planctomycetota bacterium]
MACSLFAAVGASASGQPTDARSPVFIANAPLAEEALGTIGALMSRGGEDEAVRLIQRVLEEQGDGLIASEQPGIYVPVRRRVHEVLLGDPGLLAAYRDRQTPRARALLDEGRWREVESVYWLTRPGAEAALRLAQTLLESARFSTGLGVLELLEVHPDLDAIATDAASLAATGAGFADTDDAWALAARWSASAGVTPPLRRPAERPALAELRSESSLVWRAFSGTPDHGEAMEGVVSGALHGAMLSELPVAPQRVEPPAQRASNGRPALPWAIPTIAGGHVLTADGYTVSCFDRFTLRPRWRVRGAGGDSEPGTRELRSRIGRTVEDSSSVTVDGPDAFATLGLAKSDAGRAASRVLRIDIESGRVAWSVVLGELDEALRGAEPRGPVVVDGDVVIVGARKNQRTRRLVGLTLVGLDRETGALRWMQAVGSAGSLPFQQPTHTAEGGVLYDGTVYWSDKIGLTAAVETGTGRAVWVRESIAPELYTRGARVPFATSLPVLTERGLFVLAPDQSVVSLIDPKDGRLIRQRVAEPFSDASYLVRVGRQIASVGSTRVAFYDIDGFADEDHGGGLTLSEVLEETGIRGRAVGLGDRLVLPVAEGLALLDPTVINAEGVVPALRLVLDQTGNPAVSDGQVVIAGESDVWSFLSWVTASRMLASRIDAGDFEAALSLAELAVRSGNQSHVLSAIDEAIRLAGTDRADAARVFEVAMGLIDGEARASVGLGLRGGLLERIGGVARTPEQRVAYEMGVGEWLSASGDIDGAARVYQDVLLEPDLAKTIWAGGGLRVRAELEASRRLQDLAERFGIGATRFAEDLAGLRWSGLGPAAGPEAWAGLAQRFPITRTSVRAWERAASGWLDAERWSAAERAARSGLRSFELARRRGEDGAIDPALADLLAGALVISLQSQARGEDAPALIEAYSNRLGRKLAPTSGFGPLSVDSRRTSRRALLGGGITPEAAPGLLPGTPIASLVGGDPALVLMHAPQLGRVTLYRSDPERGLVPVWEINDTGSVVPLVVYEDERSIVLVWPAELAIGRGALAQAIEVGTGDVLWETDLSMSIGSVRPVFGDPGAREGGVIASPIDGSVPSDQLLAACDGRTLFVTDRRGRAVGVDAASGRRLWAGALSMTRVFSLDMGGGVVGLAGARPRDAALPDQRGARPAVVINEERFVGLRGIAEAVDPRTGETIQMLDSLDPNARWVRVASDGQVIVGAGSGIVAM